MIINYSFSDLFAMPVQGSMLFIFFAFASYITGKLLKKVLKKEGSSRFFIIGLCASYFTTVICGLLNGMFYLNPRDTLPIQLVYCSLSTAYCLTGYFVEKKKKNSKLSSYMLNSFYISLVSTIWLLLIVILLSKPFYYKEHSVKQAEVVGQRGEKTLVKTDRSYWLFESTPISNITGENIEVEYGRYDLMCTANKPLTCWSGERFEITL
ncbi:TPA: hypothetical protein JLG91_002204 [Escherichia coli]|nr:hypothetical protein [Escherichia coli]